MNKFNLKKNVKYSLIEFLLNTGLIFLSYKLLIFTGGLELVGIWSTLYAWVMLVRIGDVGFSSSILRFVALNDTDLSNGLERVKKILLTGITFNFFVFLLLGVVGYYLVVGVIDKEYYSVAIGGPVEYLLMCMFFNFLIFNVAGIILSSFAGIHKGYVKSKLTVSANVVFLIFIVFLVPKYGLYGFAASQVIQNLYLLMLSWFFLRKELDIELIFPFGFDVITFKFMFLHSIKSQFSSMLNGLFEPMTKIILSYNYSAEIQGVYELAYKTVFIVRNLVVSGVAAVVPALTRNIGDNDSSGKELCEKTITKSKLMLFFLYMVLTVFSPAISYLWIGEYNSSYIAICVMLSIGMFFSGVYSISYMLGPIIGVFKYNMVLNFISLLMLMLFYQGVIVLGYVDVNYYVLYISFVIVVHSLSVHFFNFNAAFKDRS